MGNTLPHPRLVTLTALGRDAAGGTALTVLNLDSEPDAETLAQVRGDADILSARVVSL